jgi:hypothetical protein
MKKGFIIKGKRLKGGIDERDFIQNNQKDENSVKH